MMNSITLQGGPGDGDMVLVSEDTIHHGKYYYIERLTIQELANTYRRDRTGDKTYAYHIKRQLVDGILKYVGVY